MDEIKKMLSIIQVIGYLLAVVSRPYLVQNMLLVGVTKVLKSRPVTLLDILVHCHFKFTDVYYEQCLYFTDDCNLFQATIPPFKGN